MHNTNYGFDYVYLEGAVVGVAAFTVPALGQPAQYLGLFYVHPDHLDTPRLVTDDLNRPRWRWDSDAFGTTAANQNPAGLGVFPFSLRFPGQVVDKETNTYYNYFRDYDPSIGRYIQSDPLWLKGGINTYAYVSDSPLRWWDPYGLEGGGFDTRYGNWCGKNWSGGQQGPRIPSNPAGPSDSVDECCMAHDYCYAKFECETCTNSSENKKGKKECDKVLVSCLDALKGKAPENWPKPPPPGKAADAYFFCQKAKYYFK